MAAVSGHLNTTSGGTPLEQFVSVTGRELPRIAAARARSGERIALRRSLLADLEVDPDATIVLMGSWGRRELTRGSDDDFMVLVHGRPRERVAPTVDAVAKRFADDPDGCRRPGATDTFGQVVWSTELVTNIGLDEDTNRNLTRRALLLLESLPARNPQVHEAARAEVLAGYLRDAKRSFSPPRFLLNDVVRYWRTMGVDFVAKIRRDQGWGLRNAKLRTSRKLLFASGFVPLLRCHELHVRDMSDFLVRQFDAPPLDRLADAFLAYGQADRGVQTLVAYDQFLSLLDDPGAREELEALTSAAKARSSQRFATVEELGREIDAGLLGLLFSPALARWTQEYGIL